MKAFKDKNGKIIKFGSAVIVPDPDGTDIHTHSFVGLIVEARGDNVIVEDNVGDCFEIEPERLEITE